MKKARHIIAAILAVTLFAMSTLYAFAAETVETEAYMGQIAVEEDVYIGNISDMTVIDSEPVLTRASVSFGGSIAAGAYRRSSSSYYMAKGESYSYSVTWAPTGQSIKVCRINVDTGNVYGTSAKSGGSASGTVSSSSVPAGEYQFAVYNAGKKTMTSCTCSISF